MLKSSNLIGLSCARDRRVMLFTILPTGRIFSPLPKFCPLQLTVIINLLPSFTHPSTISQRKFISVHFKMARKVTVSKFNCVF